MLSRLRLALQDGQSGGKMRGAIEVDETNIGGKARVSKRGAVTALAWVFRGQPTFAFEGIINFSAATIEWVKNQLGLIRSADEVEKLQHQEFWRQRLCAGRALMQLRERCSLVNCSSNAIAAVLRQQS